MGLPKQVVVAIVPGRPDSACGAGCIVGSARSLVVGGGIVTTCAAGSVSGKPPCACVWGLLGVLSGLAIP